MDDIIMQSFTPVSCLVFEICQSKLNTVEPLNKGHLRTEGIVPYWEVFQKK